MHFTYAACSLLIFFSGQLLSAAELNKCKRPDETILFTDRPCQADSVEERILMNIAPPAALGSDRDSQPKQSLANPMQGRQASEFDEKDKDKDKKPKGYVASCKQMTVLSFSPYQDFSVNFNSGGIVTYQCITAKIRINGASQLIYNHDLRKALGLEIKALLANDEARIAFPAQFSAREVGSRLSSWNIYNVSFCFGAGSFPVTSIECN